MTQELTEKVYQKVQALGEQYQLAKIQVEASKQRIGELEQQNLELQLNYETVTGQATTTDSQYQNLQQTYTRLIEEKNTLETLVTDAGKKIEQVNQTYAKLELDYQTERTGYEQAATELHEMVADKEGTISSLSEQIDLFKTKQTAYETQIADYTTQLATAENQQRQHVEFLNKLEGLLDHYLTSDQEQAPTLPPTN